MPLDHIASPDVTPAATDDQATVPATDRRSLLRNAGVGAALLGAFGGGAAALTPRRASAADLDVAILNFALNLEYLEAEFYLRATTGVGLGSSEVTGTGTLGSVSGGSAVPFVNKYLKEFANDIASDEHSHVKFLRSALGSYAVARPQISLDTSFVTLARAAGFASPTQYFNPFYNDYTFLLGAYIFEDVGVTAYLGAAPLITDKAYLSAAGGILGVEAYHGGTIRSFMVQMGMSVNMVAGQISALRATLSQAQDDSGPMPTPGMSNIAPTDSNAICFSRSTRQVLNVVYGGVGATKGLFYPAGMNGAITS